jgi:tungstate transport system substrate-binding protein
MLATTTSTETGLLDKIVDLFAKEKGIELKFVAVGTGKALEIAKNCDADVVLVHAPDAEKAFVAAGYGLDRKEVMYNDFVLVGPKDDPAKAAGRTSGPR